MKTIAVYDSGFGGVYCFKQLQELLNNFGVRLLYLCDNNSCPLGKKSKQQIASSVAHMVEKANNANEIVALLLACNTATSACKCELEKMFDFKVFGLLPDVERAKRLKRQTLILATKATVKNYEKLNQINDKKNIEIIGLKNLAKIIENYYKYPEIIEKYLKLKIPKKTRENTINVVFGCSHYKIIQKCFENVFKNCKKYLSNENEIVEKVYKYCQKNIEKKQTKNEVRIMFSANDDIYINNFFEFYKNFTCPQSMSL